MATRSLLAENRQVRRAIELIELGARLQVLESETNLPYERLLRLYKEVAGKSPSKGQLPFSTDWFMTWQPNIHASLFLNVHEYLNKVAELDEIEAYAHDIALEILHHYPTMDPYAVLSSINRRRRLWSWNYYRDAFKYSEDWSDVRHRLLKKTYQWLPIVIEYQRKTSIKSMT